MIDPRSFAEWAESYRITMDRQAKRSATPPEEYQGYRIAKEAEALQEREDIDREVEEAEAAYIESKRLCTLALKRLHDAIHAQIQAGG